MARYIHFSSRPQDPEVPPRAINALSGGTGPLGVYAYPMGVVMTFGVKRPWLFVLEPTVKVIETDMYTAKDLDRDLDMLASYTDIGKAVRLWSKLADRRELVNASLPFAKLWYVVCHQQREPDPEGWTSSQSACLEPEYARELFVGVLGYLAIEDHLGVMYSSEPEQIVFLTNNAFRVVDREERTELIPHLHSNPPKQRATDEEIDAQLPSGWRNGGEIRPWLAWSVETGVPVTPKQNALYVVKPSDLAGVPLFGNELSDDHLASVEEAWRKGVRLPPITIDIVNGGYYIEDGNHRIQVAARDDRPVVAVFRVKDRARGWTPQASSRPISDRIRGARMRGNPQEGLMHRVVEMLVEERKLRARFIQSIDRNDSEAEQFRALDAADDMEREAHDLLQELIERDPSAESRVWRMVKERTPPDVLALLLRDVPDYMRENPYDKDLGSWAAIDIFRDAYAQRMLRMLWTRGEMPQAEFMERYHHEDLSLEGPWRGSRKSDNKSSFSNNFGRFVLQMSCAHCDRKLYRKEGDVDWLSTDGRFCPMRPQPVEHQWRGRFPMHEPREVSIDTRYHRVMSQRPMNKGNGNLLVWVGPTKEEWTRHLTGKELEKAFQSMEAQMIKRGDRDDTEWVERLRKEIETRRAENRMHLKTNPGRARRNPAGFKLESDGLLKFKEFHRKDPAKLEVVDFEMPTELACVGRATWVTYRSTKVDPETLEDPGKPGLDYIHEHDAGVETYVDPDEVSGGEITRVPDWITSCDTLVKLGSCLGFGFHDGQDELEMEGVAPLPTLYAIPSGKALVVVDGTKKRRRVVAMIWGGGLGVEARGIVG